MTLIQLGGRGAWLAWSGGKNAALALQTRPVEGLVLFVDEAGRFPESRVPAALREEQVASLGLPAVVVEGRDLTELRARGARSVVYGDAAGSASRAEHLALAEAVGLQAEFPLEAQAPETLAASLAETFGAVMTAVDHTRAPRPWIGRTFSPALREEWVDTVHPTGGRGELHTFVCTGPGLRRPLSPRWEDLEHTETWAYAHLVPGPRRGYG